MALPESPGLILNKYWLALLPEFKKITLECSLLLALASEAEILNGLAASLGLLLVSSLGK